jgi:DNA invertase Pin-like site-specific DNA recombinase
VRNNGVPPEKARLSHSDRSLTNDIHAAYIGRMTNARKVRRGAKVGNSALAVGYLRVSTEEQNHGPEAQRAAIVAWAEGAGVSVVAWHEDRVGGGTPVEDREALLAALADLRNHEAGLLVAAKRDRIARDVVVAATVEKMAQEAGAAVVTADGVCAADTPEGALMRGLLDLFAAYERACIRARTRAALAVKRARGEHVGGSRPFGFCVQGGKLLAVEREQATIRRARELSVSGLSLRRVAAILHAERRTARLLHPESVSRMIESRGTPA